ncbi:hypothetical protein [Ekhidna sp.]|uniref:hypothetical protein n=1 Tax=Ekhidna sp. TaxID=2608089 RepID=UPI003B59E2B7
MTSKIRITGIADGANNSMSIELNGLVPILRPTKEYSKDNPENRAYAFLAL